jgi:large subunit ribosomal protein L5e
LKAEAKLRKSYYKRYQTKFRRRREGKTNYRKRRILIKQDCNKYGALKSRFVVRRTNSRIICQIVRAHVNGDRVVSSADSTELKKYGITFGLTNYSAAYATGFLCARRALEVFKLGDIYKPSESGEEGEYGIVEDIEGKPRAFQCFLDIGLSRSSKGARVFVAMKGASDAGIKIPHSPAKFPGYDKESPDEFDGEELRARIFGKTVSDYMIYLRDNSPEKYKKQFSEYIRLGIEPESIEGIYEKAFSAIRDNPSRDSKARTFDYSQFKVFKKPRLSAEERKKRVAEKLKEVAVSE